MEIKRPTLPLGQACPFTQAVMLREPRRFLKDLGSLELSQGAGGWNRWVHEVLPLPVTVGLLADPQSRGKWPERRPPRSAFQPGMEAQDAGCRESEPPPGKKRPQACKCLQVAFRGHLGGVPAEHQFCSEAGNVRVTA